MSQDLKQVGKVVEQLSRGRTFQGDAMVGAKVLGCSILALFGHNEDASSQHRSERERVTEDEIRGQMMAWLLFWGSYGGF